MTLQEIIEQLESCNYECEAGRLENNVAFIELKKVLQRAYDLEQEWMKAKSEMTWQEAAESVSTEHAAAWARLAKE
jgi:hypothetical protein